jgi:hypothetical protein
MRLMHQRFGAAFLLVLLFAGCGTTTTGSRGTSGAQNPPPVFNLAGYSVQYKKGHADGCMQRRDDRLFRDEVDYMMGWNDGRSACAKMRR